MAAVLSCLHRLAFLFAVLAPGAAIAQELAECRRLLNTGKYEEALVAAEREIEQGFAEDDWWLLKFEARLAVGQYEQALEELERALREQPESLRLRLLAHDLWRRAGEHQRATEALEEIEERVSRTPWRYTNAESLIAVGRAALRMKADPRQVLELFFDRAKRQSPSARDYYLAAGELALSKQDGAEAAKVFREGLEHHEDDPAMHFGLARAFAPSDWSQAAAALAKTLELNPRHAGALLMLVDRDLDAERYPEASAGLEKVVAIDPFHPEAWAYRAVLAHLEAKPERERAFREKALSPLPADPAVEHLIGQKLSRHYRFSEGAAYQRAALAHDPEFVPAKVQLAQDLLRLGQEEEGWQLVEEVHVQDGYDVLAYNLTTLHDTLSQFRTLEDAHFLVRMQTREADLYGDRVLELLNRARDTLCAKYGLNLEGRVTVEIFPEQKDFAIRTFGLPGGAGYLGVCFGRVITANSPASQGANPTNWESVLWHEFCHVVTLELTRNRLPRWLSEGISVYEELQASPTWGQRMNPRYRQMILSGEFKPIGELSSAFISPPSPLHLQFAYFQSALVVEYIVERFGLESLKRVLTALAAGMPMNDALEQHLGQLDSLEKDFSRFIRAKAESLAPELDWEQPPGAEAGEAEQSPEAWLQDHPNSFWALGQLARQRVAAGQWDEARPLLEKLIELYPDDVGGENAYRLLAKVHRELGDVQAEREVLTSWAERDASAPEAYLRLMELAAGAEDWPAVAANAERMLAVNPLVAEPWRQLAAAQEALGEGAAAIESYEKRLLFDLADPAQVHYRLAALLHEQSGQQSAPSESAAAKQQAKRHVLMALEEAPRFRAAQRLLLKMQPDAPDSRSEQRPVANQVESARETTPPSTAGAPPPAPAAPEAAK